jgi:hypothetical protein
LRKSPARCSSRAPSSSPTRAMMPTMCAPAFAIKVPFPTFRTVATARRNTGEPDAERRKLPKLARLEQPRRQPDLMHRAPKRCLGARSSGLPLPSASPPPSPRR